MHLADPGGAEGDPRAQRKAVTSEMTARHDCYPSPR
jgi:hypothetical protein